MTAIVRSSRTNRQSCPTFEWLGASSIVLRNRYAAESFPGINQALRDGDQELAQAQVLVVAGCISDAAAFLSGEEGAARAGQYTAGMAAAGGGG